MDNLLQEIFDGVVTGNAGAVQTNVQGALEKGIKPKEILDSGLVSAMAEVGRRFEEGEYFVPDMLISARAMQAGMTMLKPHLLEEKVAACGKVAIGTVKGDLHDIGKNLVGMMLEGAGFEVLDLGVDVAPEKFVTAADTVDVIALSALLTTTMGSMKTTIDALKDAGKRSKVKVIIGGAPLTGAYAEEIEADGYAPDASRSVALTKALLDVNWRFDFCATPGEAMNEKIRVGAYQGPIVENNLDANLRKVEQVLEQTKNMQLDFLCFPETFLSGYSKQAVRESSIPLGDPRLDSFIQRSTAYDTVILVGLSERLDDKIYNTEIVVYRGHLLGKYHKTMLTEEDKLVFASDLDMPVFEAKGIKFGAVICADTSYVEPALCLRWQGARLLFTPHYNDIPPEGIDIPDGKVTFWEHRTMVLNNQAALATLLKMVVVRSNVVIVSEGHLGAGDACIWDMNGEIVAQGTPFTEGVVTAEFDRAIFEKENWIDRREIPVELVEKILSAAQAYPR